MISAICSSVFEAPVFNARFEALDVVLRNFVWPAPPCTIDSLEHLMCTGRSATEMYGLLYLGKTSSVSLRSSVSAGIAVFGSVASFDG